MTDAFTFDFHGSVTLSKREIWPGNNWPENPTAADVVKEVRRGGYISAIDMAEQMSIDDVIGVGVDGLPVKF